MAAPSPLILGVAAVGVVFVWSAVHGANVTHTIKDLLAGRAPATPVDDPALITLGKALPPSAAAQVGAQAGSAAAAATQAARR